MRFNEKIEMMLANGKLSPEQAEALKRSLQGATIADSCQHRTLPACLLRGVLVVAVAGVIIYAASSGHDTSNISNEIQNVAETINQSGKAGEMNKSLSTIIALALFGLPAFIWLSLGYNNLVSQEEDVLVAWSQVESNYQRRSDLIPNLINTVKTFTEHEGKTFNEIAKLRSQANEIQNEQSKLNELSKASATKIDDEQYMENLAESQNSMGNQLKNLMVSVEAYPSLYSSEQYIMLQGEFAGTENRINVARLAFNEKVGEFNSAMRRLPNNIMAGLGNFKRKAYFKADEGTNKVVKFDVPKAAE